MLSSIMFVLPHPRDITAQTLFDKDVLNKISNTNYLKFDVIQYQ